MLLFKKSYIPICILFVGITIVSCKSNFVVLTIENARPASEELPAEIQSITLLNRSMNSQFMNHREDSLQLHFYRKGFQLSTVVLDSTAADTTIRALAQLLFESGRYDVVVPVNRNINKNLSYESIPDSLSPNEVNKICTDYNTDALLVMEKFITKPMADFSSEKYNFANSSSVSYYATLDMKYDAFFRIYKPGSKTLVKEIELTDTIYWESADYTQERLFRKLPTIKQALINSGIKVALDLDEKLSPTWISEKRGYFLFEKKNDRGQLFMNENNYEAAGEFWEEMSLSKNARIRSKAEFNLALINELNGNINSAIQWGLKSFHSNYRNQTEAYLKKLKIRKETLQKTD